ncbi:MAG: hypothetical protein JNM72_20410 [Deltaproteobacteria bacterium]|nr:hypothetical protein [Deltaproteobacteria bacterium]
MSGPAEGTPGGPPPVEVVISGVASGLPELVDPFGPADGPRGPSGFDLASWGLPPTVGHGLDQGGRLALGAALIAVADAGLPLRARTGQGSALLDGRTGVVVVSRFAGLGGLVRRLTADPPAGAPPPGPALEAALATQLGAQGPRLRIGGPDASFLQGFALAAQWIEAGVVDRVVLAGADAPDDPGLPRWPGAPATLPGHAAAVLLESRARCEARGTVPIAALRRRSEGGADLAEAAATLLAGSVGEERRGPQLVISDAVSPVLSHLQQPEAALRLALSDRPALALVQLLRALQFPAPGQLRRYAVAQSVVGAPVLVLLERQADGDARVADAARRAAWLAETTGFQEALLVWSGRVLRVVEGMFEEEEPSILPPEALGIQPPAAPGPGGDLRARLDRAVRARIGKATGLSEDEVAPTHLLHAHLGLEDDTLEQIARDVADEFGLSPLPPDGDLNVGELIDALSAHLGATGPAATAPDAERLGPTLWRALTVRAPGQPPGPRPARARVFGEGPFAEALRGLLGAEDAQPTVVIDAGSGIAESLREAEALDGAPPARWVCCTHLGADPAWIDPEVGQVDGARAGFAAGLRGRWPSADVQVVDVDPMLDDAEAAALLVGELARADGEPQVWLDGPERRVSRLEREPAAPVGGVLREQPVIVVVGEPAGLAGDFTLSLARRGRVRLVLVPPTEGDAGLSEAVDALGVELMVLPADPHDPAGLRAALVEARRRFGLLDGAVAVAEGPPPGDLELLAAHTAATLPVRTLARELERTAWLLTVHRYELEAPAAADAAVDETLRRVCLSRPRSLHVCADALDGAALANSCVDLVASGVSGSLLLAPAVPEHLLRSAHPLIERLRLAVDERGAPVATGLGRLSAERLRGLSPAEGPLQLPPALVLEVMAATAAALRPGQDFVGAINLSLDAPVVLHDGGLGGTGGPTPEGARLRLDLRASLEPSGGVRCVLACAAEGGPPLRAAEALLLFGDSLPYDALPALFFFSDEPLSAAQLATLLPQGPLLGGLSEVGAIATNGLLAELLPDHRPLGGGALRAAPIVLANAIQAALLHHLAVQGRLAEPVTISRLQLDQQPADGLPVGVMVQLSEDGLYDIDVDGPGGSVLRLRGLGLLDRGPAPDERRPPAPPEGWGLAVPQGGA